MKKIFDEVAYQTSKSVTKRYSTSFSLGIKALSPQIRDAIYAIYGYVRLADEIVDSFGTYKQRELLEQFKKDTHLAFEHKIALNPIIHAFQDTVEKYNINHDLIWQFLNSMEMDLQILEYNNDLYKEYILGSAEVVGLMCLHVFVNGDDNEFKILKPYAMKLGSAFQKINFLRDLNDDFHVLGRTYFPNIDISKFDNKIKAQIEDDIEIEFQEALIGIKKLPISSKFGVYLAYKYYYSLFKKIKKTSAHHILKERIRIPNSQKLSMLASCYINYKWSNTL